MKTEIALENDGSLAVTKGGLRLHIQRNKHLQAFEQAAGFLRNGLFKRLHIHTVPTLHFHFDRSIETASDMNALISKAVASRSKNEE